jgi:hypothetical protein
MTFRLLAAAAFVLCLPLSARAQEPYNLHSPIRNLATLFTDLYGPHGLIVDSEATLPGEQPHTAHFNNDFQGNFGKFGTASFCVAGRRHFMWGTASALNSKQPNPSTQRK